MPYQTISFPKVKGIFE